MMDLLKNISLCIVGGLILNGVSVWIGSDFLGEFLKANLITLLVALLAINTTTISVIMTKLRELSKDTRVFSNSMREMRVSIVEQVVLIVLAVFLQTIMSSRLYVWTDVGAFLLSTALLAIFFYAIHILWDTANGVFVILSFEVPSK